jgi:hypothetical protein
LDQIRGPRIPEGRPNLAREAKARHDAHLDTKATAE